jgi:hypothetical protein
MVSPCMVEGNGLEYMKNKEPNVDIIALVSVFSMLSNKISIYADKLLDIIRGICYLHSEGFVHGDLRAVRLYLFMAVAHADRIRQTFSWMTEALLAFLTSV